MCERYKVVFFKQKTAYDMRISYWSSDVCSSDLRVGEQGAVQLRCVADLLGQAEPDLLERRPLRRVEFVARPVSINGRVAEFERAHAIEPAPDLARQRG